MLEEFKALHHLKVKVKVLVFNIVSRNIHQT